jgi:hypothetical protein
VKAAKGVANNPGVVKVGASAVYFLEPENGREHREEVLKVIA